MLRVSSTRRGARRARGPVVSRSLAQFAVWSVVLLVVLTAVTFAMVTRVAQDETLRDARRVARGFGQGVVAPMVDAAFRQGAPEDRTALDRLLRTRMQDGSIARIKMWDEDGTVMWSDDVRLVGRTFELGPDQLTALRTGTAVAEITRLGDPENVHETSADMLVEVYTGLVDADGRPFLFELYMPTGALEEDRDALMTSVLPIAGGALLVFLLGILPLAVSLARRVDRAGAERERLLYDAVAATDLERRRVAQDLHDGVIQDLAGLGYLLSSTPARRSEGPRSAADEALRTARDVIQRDVVSLRSLLTDLYPPELGGPGLPRAIADLAEQARRTGIDVTLTVEAADDVPLPAAVLAYRVVREALRNLVRHSGASSARVVVLAGAAGVQVEVSDDGCGLDLSAVEGTGQGPSAAQDGHLGLRLLHDTVRDVGGEMTLESKPGAGTTVSVRFARDSLPDTLTARPA